MCVSRPKAPATRAGPAQNRDTGISSRCFADAKETPPPPAEQPSPFCNCCSASKASTSNTVLTVSNHPLTRSDNDAIAHRIDHQGMQSQAPIVRRARVLGAGLQAAVHAQVHARGARQHPHGRASARVPRAHVCPVRTCGKRFSTSGNLSRHKRLHGYIEPLKCPVQGCICTFPSNNKLEKHMKFHYGTANKICSVPGCGKTFSTTGNLNRHLKNQHGHKHQQEEKATVAAISFPTLNHGASSPTSTEQWFPLPTTAVDSLWSDETLLWESSASTGLFEDVWNPALLDTLVNIFDDQTTFSC